jgi:hypothetical protein
VEWNVDAGDPLSFSHEHSYAPQLYELEWSSDS